MFVILVYDIKVRRVNKVLKACRQYLDWVQNSVFEGEITDGKLAALKAELNHIINPEVDSVLIFEFDSVKFYKKEVLGKEKSKISNFL